MLSPGDRLGRFEVLGPLGAGGMGEVYRARDAELQREVALKVLPDDLASDPDRVRRFEREARAAAALSHPNLLAVFDVGRQDGRLYLVFELLQGSTLAELTKSGAPRASAALDYAGQIARGLAAVHARGIVHRDLKPANLFVTDAGVVKIIDFGLARVATPLPGNEETTAEVTGPGVALGTVSYMSPEQSQGHVVDARSDIFSFGTVIYEMLSGRHPFKRDSAAGTVASILRDEPPELGPLPGAHAAVEPLVRRCLAKRPEDRFQSANDLAIALELLAKSDAGPPVERAVAGGGSGEQAKARPARGRRAWLFALVTGLAAVALTTAWLLRRPAVPPPRMEPLTSMSGMEADPTLSPDGEQVAFTWGGERSDNTDIYLKTVGSPELRRLTTSPFEDVGPSWSPDGRQIAFVRLTPAGGQIHVMSPLGGGERRLSDAPAGFGFAWSPDGEWLAVGAPFAAVMLRPDAPDRGIRLIRVASGEAQPVTSPAPPVFHVWPALSPDGRRLAYQSCVNVAACHVELVELKPGTPSAGPVRRLTRRPFFPQGGGTIAWTRDGSAVLYVAGDLGRLMRVDARGGREPEVVELAGHHVVKLATSVGRHRLVLQRMLSRQEIARFNPGGPSESVFTSTFGDRLPDYSPDGRRVAFESKRNGESNEIWVADADGSNARQLTHGPGQWQGSPRWSPDGQTIAFDSQGEDGNWDVWTIDAAGGPPRRITSDPADDTLPSWSRDGRFLYWASKRAGAPGTWRMAVAGGEAERIAETSGFSRESLDGSCLLVSHGSAPQWALLCVPLPAGEPRTVVDCVRGRGFAAAREGLYHVGCAGPRARTLPLYLRDPASGRDRLVGQLQDYDVGLAVAPGGRSILYSRFQGEGADLMLIENFR